MKPREANRRITAILGTYRKGGITDQTVDELLAAAREAGAETEKIYLIDKHIEFCTNCRACTQGEGIARGNCVHNDEMRSILDTLERSDAIVLASPLNFFTVTAVMKRFVERLLCLVYWPWGAMMPKPRGRVSKQAVIIGSSQAPAVVARCTTGMVSLLKRSAGLLGAKTIGVIFIGFAAQRPDQPIPESAKRRARRLGKALASPA